jgi:hypothetical protein
LTRVIAALALASLAACGGGSAATTSSSGSTSGAGGGGGSAPATCDPSKAVTACDTCVYAACCAEEARCEDGTACGDYLACARPAGCFAEADFFACAATACPKQATETAVADYQALASCIRGSCKTACGL